MWLFHQIATTIGIELMKAYLRRISSRIIVNRYQLSHDQLLALGNFLPIIIF